MNNYQLIIAPARLLIKQNKRLVTRLLLQRALSSNCPETLILNVNRMLIELCG